MIGKEETTMKTVTNTLGVMMRLVVYAAIRGAMYRYAWMEKRTARAVARPKGR